MKLFTDTTGTQVLTKIIAASVAIGLLLAVVA